MSSTTLETAKAVTLGLAYDNLVRVLMDAGMDPVSWLLYTPKYLRNQTISTRHHCITNVCTGT